MQVIMVVAAAVKQPKYEGMESLAPIIGYILEGEFPEGFTKGHKRRLIKRASSFLFLEGSLYQRGKDQVCRRVPTIAEIPAILEGLHEEACGGHFAQELTVKKILLAGYVWPSLHVDVQHWCKSCHNCQVNGNKRLLHGPRQLVIADGVKNQGCVLLCYDAPSLRRTHTCTSSPSLSLSDTQVRQGHYSSFIRNKLSQVQCI